MEYLNPTEQLGTWLDRATADERVRINVLLKGTTDGHKYSQRTNEPANPQDGMLMYFAANAVGSEEGFYGRINGEWLKLPQTAVLPAALWAIKTVGGNTHLHPLDLTTHFLVGSAKMPTALNLDIANAKLAINGTPLTNEGDLQALGSGILALKETTTPTADADHAKVYSKSDNKLYYQDGAGSEHELVDSGHTIVSHDTDGTGAELTELTDGSTTTLHAHAGGAAGGNPLDKQWLDPGTFGVDGTSTYAYSATDHTNKVVFPDSGSSEAGRSIGEPPGWSSGDTIYVDVYLLYGKTPDNGDKVKLTVSIYGTEAGEAPTGWTASHVQTLEVDGGYTDELLKVTFTISTDGGEDQDYMSIGIARDTTVGDNFDDDATLVGALLRI